MSGRLPATGVRSVKLPNAVVVWNCSLLQGVQGTLQRARTGMFSLHLLLFTAASICIHSATVCRWRWRCLALAVLRLLGRKARTAAFNR